MFLSHSSVTRIILLKYKHKSGDFWQHTYLDPDSGKSAQVGPQYPTKSEALSDTNDYIKRAGWFSDHDIDQHYEGE